MEAVDILPGVSLETQRAVRRGRIYVYSERGSVLRDTSDRTVRSDLNSAVCLNYGLAKIYAIDEDVLRVDPKLIIGCRGEFAGSDQIRVRHNRRCLDPVYYGQGVRRNPLEESGVTLYD